MPLIVVLPTYNEKENLPLMLEALFGLNIADLQVLVVDDNSPDGTGQLAESLKEKYSDCLHILHRAQKQGLGPAYIAGFKKALELGADAILQMDCDFSHQPKYIPLLIEKLKDNDLVIGSRFAKGGSVDENWGVYRKLLSWWANRVYTPTILGIPVHDATGGFKLWRRETLIGMGIDRLQSNGYVFQVEMSYIAHKLGYRIAEIPIHFPDRQLGKSKMDSSVAIEAALRVWDLRWRYRELNPAMRLLEKQA